MILKDDEWIELNSTLDIWSFLIIYNPSRALLKTEAYLWIQLNLNKQYIFLLW
jgi:hypothetical protein